MGGKRGPDVDNIGTDTDHSRQIFNNQFLSSCNRIGRDHRRFISVFIIVCGDNKALKNLFLNSKVIHTEGEREREMRRLGGVKSDLENSFMTREKIFPDLCDDVAEEDDIARRPLNCKKAIQHQLWTSLRGVTNDAIIAKHPSCRHIVRRKQVG
jgi:hypothetical protein